MWSHKTAVRAVLPDLRWLHHSPNGGKRDAFTGAQMRALGVKKGFPDLVLPVRHGDAAGLIIEMKSAIGKLSTEQAEWKDHFTVQGWTFVLARSAQEARMELCLYLGLSPDAAPPLDV